MTRSILLCADEASIRYPETLGLGGEALCEQPWIKIASFAEEARSLWKSSRSIREVWVASTDDMDAINVAAACKADRPELTVLLISFSSSGSCRTRAERARLDGVLDKHDFLTRYTQTKHPAILGDDIVTLESTRFERVPSPLSDAELARRFAPDKKSSSQENAFEASASKVEPSASRSELMLAASPEGRAFFMPIVSGSGGSGKSTIAVLSAMVAQSRGYKTLLLDLDMQFGNADMLLGIRDACCIDDVIAEPGLLDGLEPADGKPALVAAPQSMETSEALESQLPALLQRACATFEVVIANTGSFWVDQHIILLEQCSRALFLVDQRPSSLRACQHVLELCMRCGIASRPFVLGVNRCGKSAIYTSLDVSCAMQGMQTVELRDGGYEVEECLAAGLPQELLDNRNELCASIDRMLSELLPQSAQHVSSLQAGSKNRARRWFNRQIRRREAACL